MAGPSETLGNLWPPPAIHLWCHLEKQNQETWFLKLSNDLSEFYEQADDELIRVRLSPPRALHLAGDPRTRLLVGWQVSTSRAILDFYPLYISILAYCYCYLSSMRSWNSTMTMDSQKSHLGPPCPILLGPAGGPPPKRPNGRFWGGRAGGLHPSSTPLDTPRCTPMTL
jgi:hypothetical protein